MNDIQDTIDKQELSIAQLIERVNHLESCISKLIDIGKNQQSTIHKLIESINSFEQFLKQIKIHNRTLHL